MSGPENYGKYYWCVHVSKKIAAEREIYLHADAVTVEPDGSLWFYYMRESAIVPSLVLSAGTWQYFYAASVLDGSVVAVEHWAEEIDEG